MSTREKAQLLFDQMTEEQLVEFIAWIQLPSKTPQESADENEADEQAKRERAWQDLLSLCRPMPDLDEKAEKDAYFKEKYGL